LRGIVVEIETPNRVDVLEIESYLSWRRTVRGDRR
jgi:hypothetical protein